MIQFNYPEMMQEIKMQIFSADHSAIYSLACAVACIAASFGIINWYNRMMNEPYGRLDMAAVIRAGAVLLLTCSFYTTVLMPIDYVTHLVTKGICAAVDSDRDGIMGKVNEIYDAVEEARKKDSLLGAFEEEMEGENATENVDGLSYQSSAIAQSLAEAALASGGEKPGFFKRVWAGVKGFVSAKIGQVVNDAGSILSALISIIVKLEQYILTMVSSVFLIVLGLIGPFVFAFSLIPSFENNIEGWLARYIQISFWVPLTALVDMINIKLKGAMLAALQGSAIIPTMAAPLHLLVLDAVTLICLLSVPTMAGWVIQSSGADQLSKNMSVMGKKAAAMILKK